ncbi:MAG: alpha/beta fold hydrolase [Gammaproteobacteria bacterium]|nr:alpha/beta fold hydrolase [Gammaproteobacteria bacterium]MCP5202146.1 alpha/beta fold hydrolase [Gammaproteobacteria bacterium]
MATFIAIHGAFHGGWCFEPLRPHLAACGHELVAPTLPGMGGVGAAPAEVTLEGWADFVLDLARRARPPVWLCGHSRGGVVISAAAERDPAALAGLIYIAALLLPDGHSVRAHQAANPVPPAFVAAVHADGEQRTLAFDPGAAVGLFYHRSPADAGRAAAARLAAEPMNPLNTPVALSDARFGRVPRHYVECSDDRALPLAEQRAMQAVLPCATVTTLDSDHSPFLYCPAELAGALARIAYPA